jgi:hypothetical protein
MGGRTRRVVIGAAAIAALGAAGAAIAGAAGVGDDGDERPITGVALERASAAALAHTGGGQVTGTERGDEGGPYEIEVTRADGSEVDVHLDRQFRVIGTEADERDAAGEE